MIKSKLHKSLQGLHNFHVGCNTEEKMAEALDDFLMNWQEGNAGVYRRLGQCILFLM